MFELLDRFLPELTGAEFKIASYLYYQLEKQPVVCTTIAALSRATGVSWRQTQTCLQSLAEKGVLLVHSRKGHGTECRLPAAAPIPAETVSPSQQQADKIESVSACAAPASDAPAGAAQSSDAEVEARQLAAQLLGRPVDDAIMAKLQAGVNRHPHQPGAMLRRLREFTKRGRQFHDVQPMEWAVTELAQAVAELYWL